MNRYFKSVAILNLTLLPILTYSANFTVTSNLDTGSNTLRSAMTAANSSTDATNTIVFNLPSGSNTILLSSFLPLIRNNMTIDGTGVPGGLFIDAASNRGFFVDNQNTSGVPVSIDAAIQIMTVQNAAAIGGDGGPSSGGGGGMGSGLFVRGPSGGNTIQVTVDNVSF